MLKVQHYVAEKYYFFCILWISLGSHLAWYCDILANHNCYILFRLHAKDYWKEFSWYSEGGKWNYLQWHQWIWKFWTFISRKQRYVVSWTYYLCVLINFHLILFLLRVKIVFQSYVTFLLSCQKKFLPLKYFYILTSNVI